MKNMIFGSSLDYIELFTIVPIGDGTRCLCKDGLGKYFTRHKGTIIKEKLVFDTELTAQSYIDKYLDGNKYKSEFFLCNVSCLPENIIRKV